MLPEDAFLRRLPNTVDEAQAIKPEALVFSADAVELWPAAGFVDTEIRCLTEPESGNAEKEIQREFKLEAVRLIKDRGVAVAQAARDLDLHENMLRKWVRELSTDPQHAFPGHGQMKPEQQEIDRLRKEVAKLKAERDILKKAAAYFAREVT